MIELQFQTRCFNSYGLGNEREDSYGNNVCIEGDDHRRMETRCGEVLVTVTWTLAELRMDEGFIQGEVEIWRGLMIFLLPTMGSKMIRSRS